MAKSLIYKRQESVTLKVVGIFNVDDMSIEVDSEVKDIKTLVKDFDGYEVELTLKVKNDTELDEPKENIEETYNESYDE